jgi:tetratricopeptide (TPR) repeat protein
MQDRLAYIVARGRAPGGIEPYDRAVAQPRLDAAADRRAEGDVDGALAELVRAEQVEPLDPRVPVARGDILYAAGRPADAAVAYRRAIHLDPNPPAVLLALARAHRDAGHRREAIFFTEQAVWRSGTRGTLRQQAERQLERVLFPVIAESAFGDERGSATPAARRFASRESEIEWWGRIGPHYIPWASYVKVRWVDPSGAAVREDEQDRSKRVFVGDALPLDDVEAKPGAWRLEVLLGDDVVHVQPFEIF